MRSVGHSDGRFISEGESTYQSGEVGRASGDCRRRLDSERDEGRSH